MTDNNDSPGPVRIHRQSDLIGAACFAALRPFDDSVWVFELGRIGRRPSGVVRPDRVDQSSDADPCQGEYDDYRADRPHGPV